MNKRQGRKQSAQENSRATAAHMIRDWLGKGLFPERLLAPDVQDRSFTMEVVYGTIKRRRALKWIAAELMPGPADRRAVPYILTGLYQLFFLDTVADYAAVNETVEAVKAEYGRQLTGFVNGVLRSALRQREALRKDLALQPFGIRESHPDILVKRWTGQFGEDGAQRLCLWNNSRPDVIIRLHTGRCPPADLFAALPGSVRHPSSPDEFIVLPRGLSVSSAPGYEDGAFVVQDPSTKVAIDLLAPQPGEMVLDACAAPGGKTIMLSEKVGPEGSVTAMDPDPERLDRLAENVRRLKTGNVRVERGDASSEKDLERIGGGMKFDAVLLDVPCTNTGVLRRRPDARWRFSMKKLNDLTALQTRLLSAVSSHVKSGGRIAYSTCSLEAEEGEGLVKSWLANRADFELAGRQSRFPPSDGMDGVYAALLVRRS